MAGSWLPIKTNFKVYPALAQFSRDFFPKVELIFSRVQDIETWTITFASLSTKSMADALRDCSLALARFQPKRALRMRLQKSSARTACDKRLLRPSAANSVLSLARMVLNSSVLRLRASVIWSHLLQAFLCSSFKHVANVLSSLSIIREHSRHRIHAIDMAMRSRANERGRRSFPSLLLSLISWEEHEEGVL